MSSGDLVGVVARVQLQRSPLKPGPRGARVYDPSPLVEVPEAEVGPLGVVGPGGALDAHHVQHPQSRNVKGVNGLSVLPRAHYAGLRQRFGDHVVDGCAGESLLLDTDGPLTEADLAGTLLLETVDGGTVELGDAVAAPPCVEFSRWVLGRGPESPVDDEVQAAMDALQDGARGFYLVPRGTGRVAPGARLWRR